MVRTQIVGMGGETHLVSISKSNNLGNSAHSVNGKHVRLGWVNESRAVDPVCTIRYNPAFLQKWKACASSETRAGGSGGKK